MPTLQQTAVALSGAVNFLENKDVKPGSTRALITMNELGSSAGSIFSHLSETEARERQAVTDLVDSTTDGLKLAKDQVTAAKAAIKAADGKKKAVAEATLQLSKAEAAERTAEVVATAAATHAGFHDKAVILEDAAGAAQAKAETARDAADEARAAGDSLISQAEAGAEAAVAEAKMVHDKTLRALEEEVRKALGV